MPDQKTPLQSRWRTIKVFISSTFKDMYAERDHLVKVVFPALRERLGKYRVYLIDIDLRWGVTKEQADNDQVLDLCLDLIDDCRPFFIGILGERYGWVPKKFLPEAIGKYGWVQHATGKSLTELEIMHGVLNNPEMKGHAFFYLRDPKALGKIPDGIKDVYVESDPVLIKNLIDLKERIRHSGHPVIDPYPARWDAEAYDRYTKAKGRLTGLKEFGDRIQKQLWEGIKGELQLPDKPPTDTETDPLAIEQDYHERFIDSRLNVYIGRDKIHKELLSYCNGDDRRPLIVTGPSGSGKSAILARLSREGAQKDINTCVIPFFVGASLTSTALRGALQYLCNVIKKKFGLTPEIPAEADKLITTFRSFLFSIPEDKRLFLIIDAINQLDETDHPEELAWLPEELAPNVRIVLSYIDEFGHKNRFIERAREMKIAEKRVDELTNDERIEIIRKVPSVSAKTLDDAQINMLLDNPATKNPLYLLIALEELRGFGSFDELNRRISEFPKPHIYPAREGEVSNGDQGGDVIQAIFGQVIRRLEDEFDRELVSTVLPLLASARRGLSEKELSELIVDLSGKEDLFPVLRQLRSYLMERGEIIDFFHRGLYKAIHSLYLKDDEARKAYHLKLADYFEKKDEYLDLMQENVDTLKVTRAISLRKVDEFPWQLTKAKAWNKLYTILGDITFSKALSSTNEYELKEYWSIVEKNSTFRMIDAYHAILEDPERHFDALSYFAELFRTTGLLNEATVLRKYQEKRYLESNDKVNYQASLGGEALILLDRCELDDAMRLMKEQEHICRELGDKEGLQASLGNQALILKDWGRLDEAMKLLKEQEKICYELQNKKYLKISLSNQAIIYYVLGNMNEALRLLKESEYISRELGDKHGLSICQGEIGNIMYILGNLDESLKYLKKQEDICQKLGDKGGLATSFTNQSRIYMAKGDLDNAMMLLKKSEKIKQEIGDKIGLQVCLRNQAIILTNQGQYEDAIKLLKLQENICQKIGHKEGTQLSFYSQAIILTKQGKFEEAMKLLRLQEDICQKIGNKEGLQLSFGLQATICSGQNDFQKALDLYERQESICRNIKYTEGIAASLFNQALTLAKYMCRQEDALPLAEEAYKLVKDIGFSKLEASIKQFLDLLYFDITQKKGKFMEWNEFINKFAQAWDNKNFDIIKSLMQEIITCINCNKVLSFGDAIFKRINNTVHSIECPYCNVKWFEIHE